MKLDEVVLRGPRVDTHHDGDGRSVFYDVFLPDVLTGTMSRVDE